MPCRARRRPIAHAPGMRASLPERLAIARVRSLPLDVPRPRRMGQAMRHLKEARLSECLCRVRVPMGDRGATRVVNHAPGATAPARVCLDSGQTIHCEIAARTQKVEVYTFYLTLVWLSAPIPVPSVVLSCPYLGMMVEKVFCNRPYLGMMVEKVFWASHTFYFGIFGNMIPRWYSSTETK